MEIFKNYFEIGKNATAEEFRAANKKALKKRNPYTAQLELQRGAIQAFSEGRPENVQTVLSNLDEFRIKTRHNRYDTSFEDISVIASLLRLTEGNDNPSAAISLALEKIPEQAKQGVLDNLLYKYIYSYGATTTFVDGLLKAGANANAFEGQILAQAAARSRHISVVKLLHDNGASFDDALFTMQTKNWEQKFINGLKAYREEITGEPATEDAKTQATMAQLLEQVAVLTEKVGDLTEKLDKTSSATPASNANQSQKAPAPKKKKSYLSLKGLG